MVDASNEAFPEQLQQVQQVLHEIGADRIPQLLVFNKLDALPAQRRPAVLQDWYEVDGQQVPRIFVSAAAHQGLDTLRQYLAQTVLAALANDPDATTDPSTIDTDTETTAQAEPPAVA